MKESARYSRDKQKVFIVDDDISVCRALSVLLGTYGFIVETFTSSENFFKAVPDNVQGCLLLDIHMPVMDGWKTLKRIVASKSGRPVILVSATKNGGIREMALSAGAVAYLQKPFDDRTLVDLIQGVLL
ncbi:MAG: response regulator [Candidatus Omnitrophica bacterium]|nr:response regulator [Candidatus Omnitrophota bacterium]